MKILITGAAGFVGSKIVEYLRLGNTEVELLGIDNLSRKGSETNISILEKFNCTFVKGDISVQADIDKLPKVDWIIDCAAEPSVLAGLIGGSLDLINNNLVGTFYLLEKCKRDNAGFIMLSTSRVYSINELNSIRFIKKDKSFVIPESTSFPTGFSKNGVAEHFSTVAPISLYGATKLSSEIMALEYHYTFGFPVWINRCGVIAGPGQFGKIDQGIFSFWIYQYLLNKPLSFIGFGGEGLQARDLIHPFDIYTIIQQQIYSPIETAPKVINLGGGIENTLSLSELNHFCSLNIQKDKKIGSVIEGRTFDIPYYSTDYSIANLHWNWKPTISAYQILEEILDYGRNNLDHISQIN
ncbi:MAG: NAD-dependent epimerase/dehydratase family protein [Sediminibacterium sp.]|nr:NAD-dependent epimerase/dehydratase family protein [Sediminibacterium sp.]TXT32949.1 MAG: NAD-dependent epimerase/dehydratase [Chitinophagaceae bacterium]